jgi:hypothetical protein
MRKDFLVALSLANLFYLKVWDYTLYNYSEWGLSGAQSLVALVLNVLFLALIFWSAIRFVRNSSFSALKLAGRAGFFILVILALNGAPASFPDLSVDRLQERFSKIGLPLERLEPFELIVAGMILGALFSCAYRRSSRYLVSVPATILVILSPFPLILFGNGVWLWHKGALATSRPLSQPLPAKEQGKPRIVWVVFDELDYRLTFVERPASVQLPELDRLRRQSIDASRAVAPADHTQESMPSLITGRLIAAHEPIQLDEWLLTLGEKEKLGWSTLPNVFSLAREAGFNSGLAGWFLPYCRIIGHDLTVCSSQLQRDRHRQMTLPEAMLDQAKEVLPAVLPNRLIDKNARTIRIHERQTHLLVYHSVMTNAKKLAVDRNLGIVLLHYPVPHTSGIYDRRRDEFSIEPGGNYLDNLRLADRALGELRHAMEQVGLWDKTTVLVTSDHRWRPEIWKKRSDWTPEEAALEANLSTPDHRVPYLLKLAGQKQAHPYDQPFNTVLTHDLLLALLRGELASTDSVVEWLDQHRSNQRESVKDDQAHM